MPVPNCTRCGASLRDGYCEYCGWNCPTSIPDKTLTLSGLLCTLVVTRHTSTFTPKVGSPFVINNREIAQISLLQAPVVGSGELSLFTVTGITQRITFLFSQNQNMSEIASYLLHVAPDARFVNPSTHSSPNAAPNALVGVTCPKCKSKNTQSTGETRKKKVWAVIVGLVFVVTGFTLFEDGIATVMVSLVTGGVLTVYGLGFFGKKKTDCVCLNCRHKFRF